MNPRLSPAFSSGRPDRDAHCMTLFPSCSITAPVLQPTRRELSQPPHTPKKRAVWRQRLGFLLLAHLAQVGDQALGHMTCHHILHAVAQHAPLQHLRREGDRIDELALPLKEIGQHAGRGQRVRVAVAQRLPLPLQHFLDQQSRLLQLTHIKQQHAHAHEQHVPPPLSHRQPPQRRLPLSNQGLAQQADDQCVALVEAHALLQLVQNVGLVLSIAAFRLCQSERTAQGHSGAGVLTTQSNPNATRVLLAHLPHVHPRQPRLDRKEVVVVAVLSVHQRQLKGLLLLRAHHHIERCAADLGVVDLLDAVGALERLRVVPRPCLEHRVPDATDAVAEQRQVRAHVGLPDHVVAHPEERVLLPQPLLLEEVGERVEQRGDRRVEAPAHKDIGVAHVRRPLRLQPLAHGQLVLLFRAGDVELVDVAVFHVVLGELGLARLHIERDVGVDLLHRVARQLL
eukprot:scaffold3867_cov59-Phaeocystis_antarctica.AAC.2